MSRFTVAQLAWIPLGAVLGFFLIWLFDVDGDGSGWLMVACLAASGISAIGILELAERREGSNVTPSDFRADKTP